MTIYVPSSLYNPSCEPVVRYRNLQDRWIETQRQWSSMSACPYFSFSCDNNHWNCCGEAKDPDQHGDDNFSKKQPAPQHPPPPMQPPPHVVAAPPPTTQASAYAPPSDLVPPHELSPAPKPPMKTPHAPMLPCCNKTPTPAAVPSKKYEPPAWPARSDANSGVPAMSAMRPPVPHRIYEAPAPGVAPPQLATSTPTRACASHYPLAHHPQHDDTDSRVESYSQAHLQEYYY
jgi:hypothetical protein